MKKRKLKIQSLKIRYRRALKNFERRIIEEQALKESLGYGTIENINTGLFKNLNYNQLYNEGITRKVNGTTKRFKGKDAILIEIESLKRRASIYIQNELFIKNYINSMIKNEYSQSTINFVKSCLNKLNSYELAIAINENLIPQIYYLYLGKESEEEVIKRFESFINSDILSSKYSKVKSQFDDRYKNVKERYELNKLLR